MQLGKGKMTERLILLYSRDEIARRVHELARIISAHYADKDLVLIGILRGAFVFLTDLTRHLTIPAAVDFIGAASYGYHSKSSGQIQITRSSLEDGMSCWRRKGVLLAGSCTIAPVPE